MLHKEGNTADKLSCRQIELYLFMGIKYVYVLSMGRTSQERKKKN